MWSHPLLDQLDASLCDLVRSEPIQFRGEWTAPSRRTYKSETQLGTGSGPFVDVVDLRWHGALTSAGPVSGIAFLLTAHDLHWVKAPEVALTLPVDVSLHAHAGHTAEGATCLARVSAAAFFVLLLQRDLLKVGRKRLWRVRDDVASSLPANIRELLTHHRTGFVG